MGTLTLGEYLDKMRLYHPRLSMRQMAIGAGLGESVVQGIIKRNRGASPGTLNKLADAWGEPGDYEELMRLAGHPVPNMTLDNAYAVLAAETQIPEETIRELFQGPDALRFLFEPVFEKIRRMAERDSLPDDFEGEHPADALIDYLRSASTEERREILAAVWMALFDGEE